MQPKTGLFALFFIFLISISFAFLLGSSLGRKHALVSKSSNSIPQRTVIDRMQYVQDKRTGLCYSVIETTINHFVSHAVVSCEAVKELLSKK